MAQELAAAAAELVGVIIPDGEGACLGTCAVLARVFADHGIATRVVRGTYDGHAHWWLETEALRIDPTRWQFASGVPLVETLADDGASDEVPYLREQVFASPWSHEQAVAEFARMFAYHDVGLRHGQHIMAELAGVAHARHQRPCRTSADH